MFLSQTLFRCFSISLSASRAIACQMD